MLSNNDFKIRAYLFFLQCKAHSLPCPYAPKLPSPDMKGGVLYQMALWQTLMSGSSAGTLQAEGHSAKENESAIMTSKNHNAITSRCYHLRKIYRLEWDVGIKDFITGF